ncbi:MAG TPA: ComEC/Rec2 family competence protein, partial [Urbifossiella sp.]|nr:ComEC/Rec2 family competence protein [Urbifossiella sp.]
AVTSVETRDGWKPAGGRATLTVDGRLDGLHLGDTVEVVALLSLPNGPANPGEPDYAAMLLDRRITAVLRGAGSGEAVTRLEEGWRGSFLGWVSAVRGWGSRTLAGTIDPDEAGLAAALLLGDTTALDREEWDKYVRTGVVHVLAISGQHLVVLAWFAWHVLRIAGVRRRNGAWAVALLLVGYAVLTGWRPSAVRAAVMVCVMCGGLILRRRTQPANAFALAWLVVLGFNPTDPFTAGCQLSFLSVFVLVWGIGPWLAPRPLTPLEELIDETRSWPEKLARRGVRVVGAAYAVSLVLGVVNAPLVLAWQNLVSPVGILIGPPLVLATAIALGAGFVVLLVAPLSGWLAGPFAWATERCLAVCGWLVGLTERLPGAWVYAPAPSAWWLAGFSAGVAAVVLLDGRGRRVARVAVGAWAALGLALPPHRPPADELRVTFLHVGHGACVVVEPPDGRVILYDAGTTLGPDAVRRTVAPYLWHRGVGRIDEVFLSHADLDHFNGLSALGDRFPVGQVTLTPSFRDKPSAAVRATLDALARRGTPTRAVSAGDVFTAGDVSFDVLHPPAVGPDGVENVRSLVLLVRHAGNTVLLTGDLEGAGQERVVALPPPPVEGRPVAAALRPGVHLLRLPEQVRPALLLGPPDRVVRRPEVRHQDPSERLDEERVEGRVPARLVEQVVGGVGAGDAPPPPRPALDPPPGLVGVQHTGVRAVAVELLVPRPEGVGEPVPHLGPPAVGDREFPVAVEHALDPAGGDAEAVVEPGRPDDGAVAEGTAGPGVGHRGLDRLRAARAPVAVGGVLGHLGPAVVGDVLDESGAGPPGAGEFAAVGAGREPVGLAAVDVLGPGACGSGWPGTAPRVFRRGVADGLAYGGTGPGGVRAPPAGAGEPRAVRRWRRTTMAAARSRGNAASACPGVRGPARNAATKASSRIGATAGVPAILVIPP